MEIMEFYLWLKFPLWEKEFRFDWQWRCVSRRSSFHSGGEEENEIKAECAAILFHHITLVEYSLVRVVAAAEVKCHSHMFACSIKAKHQTKPNTKKKEKNWAGDFPCIFRAVNLCCKSGFFPEKSIKSGRLLRKDCGWYEVFRGEVELKV